MSTKALLRNGGKYFVLYNLPTSGALPTLILFLPVQVLFHHRPAKSGPPVSVGIPSRSEGCHLEDLASLVRRSRLYESAALLQRSQLDRSGAGRIYGLQLQLGP